MDAKKRLVQDVKNMKKAINDDSITVVGAPTKEDFFKWDCVIEGPRDTIWDGGQFKLKLEFKESYPSEPPEVHFETPIYHPNVYDNGKICISILESKNWSRMYGPKEILISIQSLLDDPNCESPANKDAADNYKNNRPLYEQKVKESVINSKNLIQW